MTALYQIANEYAKLMEEDFDPEFIADTLEGMTGELSDKIEQLLAICKNKSSYGEALKEESRKLSERAKAEESRVSAIKDYIANSLQTAGLKSLRAGIQQVSLRAAAKSVEVTDASAVPSEYVDYETVIKPHKLEIRKLLESGIEIPGVLLKTGKPSLMIK